MKRVVFLLAAVAACVLCLCAFGSKVKVFSDNFDRPERFARYWNHNAGEVPGTVEYLPEGGADGSGCVKIASAEKTALAIKHKLTGLHPGKLYRLSALMKCDSVQDGRGAVLYLDPGQTYSVNIVGQSTQLRDAAKDRLKLRHPDEVASQGADR